MKSNELCGVLNNALIRVHVDKREQYTPGWKFNDWEMKGIPLRVEIGPRDLENNEVTLVRRDTSSKIKVKTEFVKTVSEMLNIIQSEMLERARQSLIEQTSEAQSYDELSSMMEAGVGFVKAGWCGSEDCENNVKDKTGADVRLLPLEKEELSISCIICGNVAKHIAYFARAY